MRTVLTAALILASASAMAQTYEPTPQEEAAALVRVLLISARGCAAFRHDPSPIRSASPVAKRKLTTAGFSQAEADAIVDRILASSEEVTKSRDGKLSCSMFDAAVK